MRLAIYILCGCLLFVSSTCAANKKTTKVSANSSSKARSYISSTSCKQVIADIDKPGRRQQLALMVGAFISGSNYAKNRDFHLKLANMDADTKRFCRQHPEKSITDALINLDRAIDQLNDKSTKKIK